MKRANGPTMTVRRDSTELVRILDTTLRDGEQSPGVALRITDKLEIAEHLSALGVDIIEAGFPAAGAEEAEAVRRIASFTGRKERVTKHGDSGPPPCIAAMARATRLDIEHAIRAVCGARFPRIHIVIATSDLHLRYKLKKTRDEILDMIRTSICYAREKCSDIEFCPEDATRTDKDFLLTACEVAVEAGATTLNIPDTVGYAVPEELSALAQLLRRRFSSAITLSVHCHNDLGLATANTLAAVANGVRQVEVTINGLGERAGNACLAETVMALRTRQRHFQLATNIVTKQLCDVSRIVSRLTGIGVPPNKAVVGSSAFSHVGGIHQDGVLKDKRTYEIMSAEDVGAQTSRVILGKYCGRNALRSELERLGYKLSKERLDDVLASLKAVISTQRFVTDATLHSLCSPNELQLDANAEDPADRLSHPPGQPPMHSP